MLQQDTIDTVNLHESMFFVTLFNICYNSDCSEISSIRNNGET